MGLADINKDNVGQPVLNSYMLIWSDVIHNTPNWKTLVFRGHRLSEHGLGTVLVHANTEFDDI